MVEELHINSYFFLLRFKNGIQLFIFYILSLFRNSTLQREHVAMCWIQYPMPICGGTMKLESWTVMEFIILWLVRNILLCLEFFMYQSHISLLDLREKLIDDLEVFRQIEFDDRRQKRVEMAIEEARLKEAAADIERERQRKAKFAEENKELAAAMEAREMLATEEAAAAACGFHVESQLTDESLIVRLC